MLTRDEALRLLTSKVRRRNIVKHCLAVEAIMKGLARRFGEDQDRWGLIGLLHDLDFDETLNDAKRHGVVAVEMLKNALSDDLLKAILSHNFENTGVKPETLVEKALVVADALSGLVVACALVMPNKKLSEVKIETLEKKFKSKDFARGVDRSRINLCSELGLSREELFKIGLESMLGIAEELGL